MRNMSSQMVLATVIAIAAAQMLTAPPPPGHRPIATMAHSTPSRTFATDTSYTGRSMVTQAPIHRNEKRSGNWTASATIVIGTVTSNNFPPYICGFSNGLECHLQCPTSRTCAQVAGAVTCTGDSWDWYGTHESSIARYCLEGQILHYTSYVWSTTVGKPGYYDWLIICNTGMQAYCQVMQMGNATAPICAVAVSSVTIRTITVTPKQDIVLQYAHSTLQFDTDVFLIKALPPSTTAMPDYVKKLKDAPNCLAGMETACPSLSSLLTQCGDPAIDGSNVNVCFCNNIGSASCTGACATSNDASNYLHWVVPFCRLIDSNWTETWVDHSFYGALAFQDLLPWHWQLSTANSTATNQTTTSNNKCPSAHQMLASFAAINAVVFVGSIIVANRHVVNFITCGLMAKPGQGSFWWLFFAFIGVAINLVGNYVNALLIQRTPGFSNAPIGELILLWCTRPRLAWMVVLFAVFTKWVGSDETIFISGAVSAVLTEIVLQILAFVYMGRTVRHAASHGYYKLRRLNDIPHGQDAWIMYAGALLWLVWVWLVIGAALLAFSRIHSIVKFAVVATWTIISWPFILITRHNSASKDVEHQRSPYSPSMDETETSSQCFAEEKKATVYAYKSYDSPGNVLSETQLHDRISLSATLRELKSSAMAPVSDRERSHTSLINQFEVYRMMGFEEKVLSHMQALLFLLLIVWLAQWLFWAGFLRLAEGVYCPPKIWTMSGVWSGFSTLAVFLGSTN